MKNMTQTKRSPYVKITFQRGNRKNVGQNGCRMEDVVDVLIDRLTAYQSAMYKNQDNELALMYLQEAKQALARRSAVYDD